MSNEKKLYTREGNYIYFGSYPQGENGEIEPIKWRILSEENGEALLLSEYILDAHRFDKKSNNYKDSEIRKWLNNEFYNKAFNENEKQIILTTEVDNSERSTNPNRNANEFNKGKNKHACENTQDKVFLLSMQEATNPKYGFDESDNSHKSREKKPTAYAIKQGAWYDDEEGCETYGNGYWWLRSPLYCLINSAWIVDYVGGVDYSGVDYTDYGVAGALKIKL